jgi:LacI family transcriptional regulator
MSVTLNNIATELGISHMTVSRALKGDPAVADKTRKRVLSAALKMGYRPNASARSMRSGRFGSLGLLAGTVNSYLPGSLIRGVRDGCAALDLHLQVDSISDDQANDQSYLPRFLQYACVDALMISHTGAHDMLTELINHQRLPAVWINEMQDTNAVYPDEQQGGRIAAEYLLAMGHKKIAYAAAHLVDHFSTKVRYQGINATLAQAGLPQAKMIAAPDAMGNEINQSALPTMVDFLKQADRPTAIICRGQADAVCAYAAAMQLGLRVPEDLSIVTFNDKPILSVCALPIDTLIIPFLELGVEVAKMTNHLAMNPDEQIASQVITYQGIQSAGSCQPPIKP